MVIWSKPYGFWEMNRNPDTTKSHMEKSTILDVPSFLFCQALNLSFMGL